MGAGWAGRAHPPLSELSFGAGEALTLLLGAQAPEGWWLGCRCDGAAGLVPQTYVQPRPELPTVGVPASSAQGSHLPRPSHAGSVI